MSVTYYASQRHFADHMIPVWRETGGDFVVPFELEPHMRRRNVNARYTNDVTGVLGVRFGTVVVSSISDLNMVRRSHRRIVFMNHGSGQSFNTPHSSYSGGPKRDAVKLFLEPNEFAASRTRAAYPHRRTEIIGCPKLDDWHNATPKARPAKPVVAVSFHWDALVLPETRSAFGYYKAVLPQLAAEYTVIGHGHPRIWQTLQWQYRRLGIEPVEDFEEVLRRADIYVNDCSSTLWEFASLDRPVVVLNIPAYRRDVEHGMRFWEWADIGPNVDHPSGLQEAVAEAWRDETPWRRREIVDCIYPNRGEAAKRAAALVLELDADQEDDMATYIFQTRKLGGGRFTIAGEVGGVKVIDEFDLGTDNPSLDDCAKALRNAVRGESPPPSAPRVLTLAEMRALAKERGVTVKGTRKADVEEQLRTAGVL